MSGNRSISKMKLLGKRFCNVEKCEASNGDCEACVLVFLDQELDPFTLEMHGYISKERAKQIQAIKELVDKIEIFNYDDGSFEAEVDIDADQH